MKNDFFMSYLFRGKKIIYFKETVNLLKNNFITNKPAFTAFQNHVNFLGE